MDSILIMITLAFDKYDFKRKTQYPNGWNVELYKYADTLDVNDCFQIVRNKFILASNHSELRGNVLNRLAGKYVILDKLDIENYDGEVLFYPIEIYGSHNYFNESKIYKTDDNIEYNVNFINAVSDKSIKLAKSNKLYFVFNISHEPFSDLNFLKKVTYLKIYDDIRNLYSSLKLSKLNNYKAKHFSFNVDGGRCENCKGEGNVKIEMQFMADVSLMCENCKGKRFKNEILKVKYHKKSIDDILTMTVDEAIDFFSIHENQKISNKLIQSKCGWTPFHGMKVTGWPVGTMINGNKVFWNEKIIGIEVISPWGMW